MKIKLSQPTYIHTQAHTYLFYKYSAGLNKMLSSTADEEIKRILSVINNKLCCDDVDIIQVT